MDSSRTAACVAMVLVLGGCASYGGILGPRATGGPLPARRDIAAAITLAKARLDGAVRRDDSAAVTAALTADAVLIAGPDTLRGADALWRYLRRGPRVPVRDSLAFRARGVDYCTDGAVERGAAMVVTGRFDSGPQEVLEQPAYALRWVVDAAGTARIRAAELSRPGGSTGRRAVPAVPFCALSLDAAALPRRRAAVTVAGPAAVFGRGLFAGWRDVLAARGYVPERVFRSGQGAIGATEQHDPLVVGVRLRTGATLSVELDLAPLAARTELRGVEPTTGNVAWLWDDARWGALLVGWGWRRLRIAAGPLVVRSDRRLMNHLLRAPDGTPFVVPVHQDVSWKESAAGMLGQAAYAYPVTGGLFVELQARWKLATGHTRALQDFPGAALGLGGWSVGLAVGAAR